MSRVLNWIDTLFFGVRRIFAAGVELPERPALNFVGAVVTVLRADLTVAAFGARILRSTDEFHVVDALHAHAETTAEARTTNPIKHLGTRHNSAASFAFRSPGSLIFVASEDGILSAMIRPDSENHVYIWRPMSLTWSFPFRTAHNKRSASQTPAGASSPQ
ncbi:hypothetical protein [Sorangium sp. So ce385]|uniref:hypothetical protein n=1 Tax=Sorangium sp. So ce385 TaxID=3133308 RepID=UPI003F5BABE9